MLPASQSACVTVEVAAIATEARTRLPITAMTATRAESRFVMQTLPGEVGTCTYQRGPYAFARPPAIGRFGIGRGPRDPRAGDTACFRARSRLGGRRTVYRTADGVGFWRANGGPGWATGRKSPHDGNQHGRTPRDDHGRWAQRPRHGADRVREQRRRLVECVHGSRRCGAVVTWRPRGPRPQAEERPDDRGAPVLGGADRPV